MPIIHTKLKLKARRRSRDQIAVFSLAALKQ